MKNVSQLSRTVTTCLVFGFAFTAFPATAPSAADAPKPPITIKIVGSIVKNQQGEYLGRIQDIILNPETGHSEFAMLLLGYPKNTSRVIPIPWALLRHVTDQGQNGGVPGAAQVFELNTERFNLGRAPVLNASQYSLIASPEWRRQVYHFFGMPVASAAPVPPPSSEPYPVDYFPQLPTSISSSASSASVTSFDFDDDEDDMDPGFPQFPHSWNSPWHWRALQADPMLDQFPPLFPGGEPVLPNGRPGDIFTAATNFFPGAPARLPRNNLAGVPHGTPLVPSVPGAPWSPLVPGSAKPLVPVTPGAPWSPLVPENSKPLVPLKPGAPWSPLIPQNSQPLVAVNPGAPWSPLVPAGSTPGTPVNPGAPWSPLIPPGSAPTLNSGSPWTPAVTPQQPPQGSGGRPWATVLPQQPPQGLFAGGRPWSPAAPQSAPQMGSGAGRPWAPVPPQAVPPQVPAGNPGFNPPFPPPRFDGPPPRPFGPGFRSPMHPGMGGFRPIAPIAPLAPIAPMAPLAGRR